MSLCMCAACALCDCASVCAYCWVLALYACVFLFLCVQ